MVPQSDGSIQIQAPAPGRYRLVAHTGTNTVSKAILISPNAPTVPIRGLTFGLGAWENGQLMTSAAIRSSASERLNVAKHLGVQWIVLTYAGCVDFDSGGQSFGQSFVVDPVHCPTVNQSDLEWIIDEAHRQGYLVSLEPLAGAIKSGVYKDLQFNFPPGNAQLLQLQTAYISWEISVAAIAQKHSVESMFVGDNFPTPYASSPDLDIALVTGWNSLLDQLKQVYSGKIWFAWLAACSGDAGAQQGYFSSLWPRVDAVHIYYTINGSGNLCPVPGSSGYNNISAEDMGINLADRADPRLMGFGEASLTGLPIMWTDFYPVSYDSMNYRNDSLSSYPAIVWDFQEDIDKFEALMRANSPNKPSGFFPWAMDLWSDEYGYSRSSLLAQPAFLHSFANWMGGDPSYFDSCLVDQTADVIYQSNFSCPVGKYSMRLLLGADVALDPQPPFSPILQIPAGGFAALDGPWGDFILTYKARLRSSNGIAQLAFAARAGAYAAYNLSISATSLSLTKYVAAQSATTAFGTYKLPVGSVGQWLDIGLKAVGAHMTVSLNGTPVIDATDTNDPLLPRPVGSTASYPSFAVAWTLFPSSTSSPFIFDVDQIAVRKVLPFPPPAQMPFLQSVVNSASYDAEMVTPGEVVALFGANLGPSALATLQLDASGHISSLLAGTRVLFDGVPAPIVYTQANQVCAIVPFEVSGSATNIQVEYHGQSSPPLQIAVGETLPGIFTADSTGIGQVAALNADGSYNSANRPAARGSILTLFLTGHGAVVPAGVDGEIVGAPAPSILNKVQAWVGQQAANIVYAGVAPFETNGLMQLNLTVPMNASTGPAVPILVGIGSYVTQRAVTVAIQ